MNDNVIPAAAGRRGRPLDDWPGRLRHLVRARLRRHAREQAAARARAAAGTPAVAVPATGAPAAVEAPPPPPAVRSLMPEVLALSIAIAGAAVLLLLTGVALALDFPGLTGDPLGLAAMAGAAVGLGFLVAAWYRRLARRLEEVSGAR